MSKLLLLALCCARIQGAPIDFHPPPPKLMPINYKNPEITSKFWNDNALNTLKKHVAQSNKKNVAKNVILFLGDGMSVPTLAATRAYVGNENVQLSFEKFPHTAISKTYCVDYQVSDSACTATAYLTGVKANKGTIGVNANVAFGDCKGMTNRNNHVRSIFHWAQVKGKSTGLVTTARVSHASPAGVFGHTSSRKWESDTDIINDKENPKVCTDLTTQLVKEEVGKKLKVIMGGGRRNFLPMNTKDEEGDAGVRSDGVNLINVWKTAKHRKQAKYIWNRDQLLNLDDKTEHVLGLFESDHCRYNLERDQKLDPTLAEMTKAAIRILSKNSEGYYLFVEGAHIDMGHHYARAHIALDETVEFSKAVEVAVNITSEDDTLIVVTSDHAHTMTISGYPVRKSNILGVGGTAADNISFTILNYANGPGYNPPDLKGRRYEVSKDNFANISYQYPGTFPLQFETHGGDDVIIFARGPWSHLFTGVVEQNVIPHFIGYASCVGQNDAYTACNNNIGNKIYPSVFILNILSLLKVFM